MRSFQSALHALSFEGTLARLLATTPRRAVERLADWVASSDPYGEHDAILRALQLVSSTIEDPREHIRHQLWCAWRQAAWTSGLAKPLPIRVEGLEFLAETEERPTILVTPMTLAPADAMNAIARLNVAGRACVVFGEDLQVSTEDRLEIVTGMSTATVRRILEVLDARGILCTYPDFVYEGRTAESIRLFGTERPISSGFVSLASRNDTMLLPLICMHQDELMTVHIEEPLLVQNHGASDTTSRTDVRELILTAVGDLLESLIRRAPEQWLLLSTLTFESPEMARAQGERMAETSGASS